MSYRPTCEAASAMLLALAFANDSAAQSHFVDPSVRRGAFSSIQSGIRLHGSNQIYRKAAGDQSAPPVTVDPINSTSGGTAPDYGKLDIVLAGIDIDAHSSGNGVYPQLNASGLMELDGPRWLTVTASVKNGSDGTADSHFRAAATASQETGSELVTYYLPGASLAIDPAFPGKTYQQASRSHLGFGSNTVDDVSALDFGLAFQIEAPGSVPAFPEAGTYYFSVAKSWSDTNQSPFYALEADPDNPTELPHAADIYAIKWGGSSWGVPSLHMSHTDLGFGANGDLDAMDVHPLGRVIYSPANFDHGGGNWTMGMEPTALEGGVSSQIMYFDMNANVGDNGTVKPTVLKDGNGDSVASKVGVDEAAGGDEVDSLCTIDPEQPTTGYPEIGFPIKSDASLGDPFGLSISRSGIPPGTSVLPGSGTGGSDWLEIQATGWGSLDPVTCFILLYSESVNPGDPAPSFATLTGGQPIARRIRYAPANGAQDTVSFQVTGLPQFSFDSYSEVYYYAQLADRWLTPIAGSVVSRIAQ